jgi:glycosyltransferase involved in cell wall biosynthesis
MKLHVLPNPSGITHPDFRMDAFNIAVWKFTQHMQRLGYEVIHYGHESSAVDCEHVTVITNDDFAPPAPDWACVHDPRLAGIFSRNVSAQLQRRVNQGDLVLSFYGNTHQPATDLIRDRAAVVEPAIGYEVSGVYADFRGFTSQAWMHYFYGSRGMLMEPSWYDEVIPNAITPGEFRFDTNKSDYFMYIGRMVSTKGIALAIQVTQHLGQRLLIGSPGRLSQIGYSSVPDHVVELGYLGPRERARLLSRARGLFAPTHYIEPFGNVVAEAAMCGTPVITSDWGGFVDTVLPGVTGFRCRDFQGFVTAAASVDEIDPQTCRDWAMQEYSDDSVHAKFDRWFRKIQRRDFYWLPESAKQHTA